MIGAPALCSKDFGFKSAKPLFLAKAELIGEDHSSLVSSARLLGCLCYKQTNLITCGWSDWYTHTKMDRRKVDNFWTSII